MRPSWVLSRCVPDRAHADKLAKPIADQLAAKGRPSRPQPLLLIVVLWQAGVTVAADIVGSLKLVAATTQGRTISAPGPDGAGDPITASSACSSL
jgi:hypothetical protein